MWPSLRASLRAVRARLWEGGFPPRVPDRLESLSDLRQFSARVQLRFATVSVLFPKARDVCSRGHPLRRASRRRVATDARGNLPERVCASESRDKAKAA